MSLLTTSVQIDIRERDAVSLVPLQTYDRNTGEVTGDRPEEDIKKDQEAAKDIKYFDVQATVGEKVLRVHSPKGKDHQRSDLLGEALNRIGKAIIELISK